MPDTVPTIIEVAVPLPVDGTFSYRLPTGTGAEVRVGMRALVPFGRRTLSGFVVGLAPPADSGRLELRDVVELLDREPLFGEDDLAFYRWVATYYLHPLGEVIRTALPAGLTIASRRTCRVTAHGTVVAEELLRGGQQVRTETVWGCAAPLADGVRLGVKAAAILTFLQEAGESTTGELRRRFGECGAQLARLRELGTVDGEVREVYRDPFRATVTDRDTPAVPNRYQAEALARLAESIDAGGFAPFLLQGVTGSGKTEVYLQAIQRVLAAGRTALVLVPEIALTPQLVGRFRCRFGGGIAVLHSALADGERFDEWRRIRRGEATIVIGARSAVFAPLQRLGIIVVDEEHEPSYKQADGLRYNARDLALVRGKLTGACVVLGSATPQLTTFHAAREGRIGLLPLPERVRDLPLPPVELVDQRGRKGETLTPELLAAIEETLAQGGQTLLFLNRRGFATWLVCRDCGHVLHCPNCSVTLTFHQRRGEHVCHYCDFTAPAPSVCPDCASTEIVLLGRGTERVEAEIRERFPDARVARMDRDTTAGRGGHARVLQGVADGSIDILVGTQMVAKGHDFPGVTLVGVIAADVSLNLPDFRSGERTFQLLAQVAGRAGRGDQPGRVLVQTMAPDHYAIARAATHDYEGFCAEELDFRRELGYPPFAHLALLAFSGVAEGALAQAAEEALATLRRTRDRLRLRVELLGPAVPMLGRVRGRHRRQILLKATSRPQLHRLLATFRDSYRPPLTVRCAIDIDPVEML